MALLSFNLGVEAGQVLFIAAIIAGGAVLSRVAPAAIREIRTSGSAVSIAGAYVIGGVSAYWFIARITAF